MIELPRAALKADELAQSAEFFGFGTNDLTQTTLGMSRDDTGAILDEYRARGVYVADPFASIDVEGVGCLVKLACEKARCSNPKIWLGVCGEHGGDLWHELCFMLSVPRTGSPSGCCSGCGSSQER